MKTIQKHFINLARSTLSAMNEKKLDLLLSESFPSNHIVLEHFIDRLDWELLSENHNLPWTTHLIDDFLEKWVWGGFPYNLSENPSLPWSESLLEKYKKKWDWSSLSRNKNIPWSIELIEKYKDKWDWSNLSRNENIPWSIELIEKYRDKWDWSNLSWNSSLPWSTSLITIYQNKLDFKSLSGNKAIPWSLGLIEKYKNELDWQGKGLESLLYDSSISLNPSLPWSSNFIERYKYKLNWSELSGNEGIPWTPDLIEKFANDWDWETLSRNSSLPWSSSLIERYKNKLNWKSLSSNPSLPKSTVFIEFYKDKLDWEGLSGNSGLPWSIEFIECYEKRWHWEWLSSNTKLPWSLEFIEYFVKRWDWGWLSTNRNLPWSLELVEKYRLKWEWDSQSKYCDTDHESYVAKYFSNRCKEIDATGAAFEKVIVGKLKYVSTFSLEDVMGMESENPIFQTHEENTELTKYLDLPSIYRGGKKKEYVQVNIDNSPSKLKLDATEYLHEMTGNPKASFHDEQWESIDELVNKKKQLLVVQRTGWGKSAVYFIATKIRRSQGFGPTLIISPLLSLIRNQIDSAAKLGLKVVSYNSSMDKGERESAENQILMGQVDAVIVAPEQLGQTYFAERILSSISGNIGLFVVDEAHCISDWGHDFRPDYGRIVRVLKNMPQNMPVLATTATANNRVVNDIKDQLGDRLSIIRGSLTRKSLQLQNIDISNKSERLAWLAQYLNDISGTGIIYAKTTKDCEIVAGFLQEQGIDAHAYHSQLGTNEQKENLEQRLINNEIKALVSTSALGMGFDKPDLSFVIHYQSPGNVVEYYQQVGRAGRGIDSAIGIMMLGKEDGRIQQYFIENAFPKENQINQLLLAIEQNDGMKLTELEPLVNFAKGTIESILKFLIIEQPSPILKDDKHYFRTQFDYQIPEEKIERLNTIKQREWGILNAYHKSTSCLMQFLSKELDDPNSQPCGKCENCKPADKLPETIDDSLVLKANDYLRHRYIQIKPRATFASSGDNARLAFTTYELPYSANKSNLNIESGMALSSWKDGGWGDIVAEGKRQGSFSHDLIPPMVKMINSIFYEQRPTWLTYIPSPRHPNLVKNFAHALAKALGVECKDAINIAEVRPPQKTMENSFHQSKNLDGAFGLNTTQGYAAPVWLLDDAVDSRWTFTIAGALLRQNGIPKVVPIALTSTSKNS